MTKSFMSPCTSKVYVDTLTKLLTKILWHGLVMVGFACIVRAALPLFISSPNPSLPSVLQRLRRSFSTGSKLRPDTTRYLLSSFWMCLVCLYLIYVVFGYGMVHCVNLVVGWINPYDARWCCLTVSLFYFSYVIFVPWPMHSLFNV